VAFDWENGVFPRDDITSPIQVADGEAGWPADAADIYKEIAADDLRVAEAMLPSVRETWPACEEKS